jgi:hypothetical protein
MWGDIRKKESSIKLLLIEITISENREDIRSLEKEQDAIKKEH